MDFWQSFNSVPVELYIKLLLWLDIEFDVVINKLGDMGKCINTVLYWSFNCSLYFTIFVLVEYFIIYLYMSYNCNLIMNSILSLHRTNLVL